MKTRILSLVLILTLALGLLPAVTHAATVNGSTNNPAVTAVYDDETATVTLGGSGELDIFYWGDNEIRLNAKHIVIGPNVTGIISRMVCEYPGLESITVDGANPELKSVDGVLYNKAGTELIAFPAKKGTAFTVPEGVTRILYASFNGNSLLQSIQFPQSLEAIEGYAFEDCSGLTSVHLPKNLHQLSTEAFFSCINLETVTLDPQNTAYTVENNVLYLEKTPVLYPPQKKDKHFAVPYGAVTLHSLFACNPYLESVTLPDSLKYLYGTFFGCTALKSVNLPDGFMELGNETFYGCTALESVTLPADLIYIGSNCFAGATALKNVTFSCKQLTEIHGYAFENCTALKNITLPKGIEMISYGAFHNTGYYNDPANWKDGLLYNGNYLLKAKESLTGAVTVAPGTVLVAGEAFFNCKNITSISLPEGLLYIGDFAFVNTTALESINIPDSIVLIRYNIFSGSKLLMDHAPENGIYYVDHYAITAEDLTHVTIKEGTVGLAEELFYYSNIKSVTLPDSLRSIGNDAFSFCYDLESVTFGAGLKYIGQNAFTECSALKSIDLPEGLEYIGTNAFNDCTDLTEVSVPDSVTYMGNSVFEDCENLTYAKLPKGMTEIPSDTLKDCPALTDVVWPAAPTRIGNEAFEDTGLRSVVIPGTVTYIDKQAFYSMADLKSITIPKSVTYIGEDAFGGTSLLEHLEYEGTPEEWAAIEKAEDIGLPNGGVKPILNTARIFRDVKANQWYKPYVDYAYSRDLFKGTSATKFEPNATMNRAMFVTVLSRIAGVEVEDNATTVFTDVKAGQWYTGAVAWAAGTGIVKGMTATTFAPTQPVTREQMCVFLTRYAAYAGITLKSSVAPVTFADQAKISGYAKESVAACQKAGIINGVGNNAFDPKGSATRAQVAKILTVYRQDYVVK